MREERRKRGGKARHARVVCPPASVHLAGGGKGRGKKLGCSSITSGPLSVFRAGTKKKKKEGNETREKRKGGGERARRGPSVLIQPASVAAAITSTTGTKKEEKEGPQKKRGEGASWVSAPTLVVADDYPPSFFYSPAGHRVRKRGRKLHRKGKGEGGGPRLLPGGSRTRLRTSSVSFFYGDDPGR